MELKDIITEEGLKVSGNGIIIKILEKIDKKLDRNNLLLSFIEKKIEKLQEINFNKK